MNRNNKHNQAGSEGNGNKGLNQRQKNDNVAVADPHDAADEVVASLQVAIDALDAVINDDNTGPAEVQVFKGYRGSLAFVMRQVEALAGGVKRRAA